MLKWGGQSDQRAGRWAGRRRRGTAVLRAGCTGGTPGERAALAAAVAAAGVVRGGGGGRGWAWPGRGASFPLRPAALAQL